MVNQQSIFPDFYCECFPHLKGKNHYNVAIALIFRQCFYTNNDIASYILGWLSIIGSMISLFPQIITNLVGCILTNQLATQLYLAAYYVLMDIIIIGQYTYYEFKIEKFKKFITRIRNFTSSKKSTQSSESTTVKTTTLPSHSLTNLLSILLCIIFLNSYYTLAQNETPPSCSYETPELSPSLYIVGTVCSYVSCLCYIAALVPQVVKNYKRKGVKGLSVSTCKLWIRYWTGF